MNLNRGTGHTPPVRSLGRVVASWRPQGGLALSSAPLEGHPAQRRPCGLTATPPWLLQHPHPGQALPLESP
jgi:hypothetical protein